MDMLLYIRAADSISVI